MLKNYYYKSIERNGNETQIGGQGELQEFESGTLKTWTPFAHISRHIYNIPVTLAWIFRYVPKTVT